MSEQIMTGADPTAPDTDPYPATDGDPGVEEELLLEEVSIDGMCGVY